MLYVPVTEALAKGVDVPYASAPPATMAQTAAATIPAALTYRIHTARRCRWCRQLCSAREAKLDNARRRTARSAWAPVSRFCAARQAAETVAIAKPANTAWSQVAGSVSPDRHQRAIA